MTPSFGASALTVFVLTVESARGQGPDWSTLAATPERSSWAEHPPVQLGPARWVASTDDHGFPISFEGQSGVVTRGDRVYALGRSGGLSRLYGVNAVTGQVLWGSPVPAPVLESWAAPTVDPGRGTVLVASGRFVTAIHGQSGAQVWQAQLDRNTAGAVPAVTGDLGPADRAFITDYDGFGGAGKLYCISIGPLSPTNPYQPGQIVWSVTLGTTSANTPAYANGTVYVSSVSDATGALPGLVRAFDATATTPPPPRWMFTNVTGAGFFGGVSVSGGAVFAASYSFAGGQNAANLVKLDAATGTLLWSASCNRTDTIPVRLPDGSIILSAGIRGFGSIPSIQRFRDDGAAAVLLWDSALDSWVDANSNLQMDPGEYIDVGGWTIQQAISTRPGLGPVVFAGVLPLGASTSSACTTLMELDLSRVPSDPLFVRRSFSGAGSSPAIASGGLYTLGPAGLHALGAAPCLANCDASSGTPALTANDFLCFLNLYAAGDTRANCDETTGVPTLTANDFLCFLNRYAAGCP